MKNGFRIVILLLAVQMAHKNPPIPTTSNILEPQFPTHRRTKSDEQKKNQRRYYNRDAYGLELVPSELVPSPLAFAQNGAANTVGSGTSLLYIRSYKLESVRVKLKCVR